MGGSREAGDGSHADEDEFLKGMDARQMARYVGGTRAQDVVSFLSRDGQRRHPRMPEVVTVRALRALSDDARRAASWLVAYFTRVLRRNGAGEDAGELYLMCISRVCAVEEALRDGPNVLCRATRGAPETGQPRSAGDEGKERRSAQRLAEKAQRLTKLVATARRLPEPHGISDACYRHLVFNLAAGEQMFRGRSELESKLAAILDGCTDRLNCWSEWKIPMSVACAAALCSRAGPFHAAAARAFRAANVATDPAAESESLLWALHEMWDVREEHVQGSAGRWGGKMDRHGFASFPANGDALKCGGCDVLHLEFAQPAVDLEFEESDLATLRAHLDLVRVTTRCVWIYTFEKAFSPERSVPVRHAAAAIAALRAEKFCAHVTFDLDTPDELVRAVLCTRCAWRMSACDGPRIAGRAARMVRQFRNAIELVDEGDVSFEAARELVAALWHDGPIYRLCIRGARADGQLARALAAAPALPTAELALVSTTEEGARAALAARWSSDVITLGRDVPSAAARFALAEEVRIQSYSQRASNFRNAQLSESTTLLLLWSSHAEQEHVAREICTIRATASLKKVVIKTEFADVRRPPCEALRAAARSAFPGRAVFYNDKRVETGAAEPSLGRRVAAPAAEDLRRQAALVAAADREHAAAEAAHERARVRAIEEARAIEERERAADRAARAAAGEERRRAERRRREEERRRASTNQENPAQAEPAAHPAPRRGGRAAFPGRQRSPGSRRRDEDAAAKQYDLAPERPPPGRARRHDVPPALVGVRFRKSKKLLTAIASPAPASPSAPRDEFPGLPAPVGRGGSFRRSAERTPFLLVCAPPDLVRERLTLLRADGALPRAFRVPGTPGDPERACLDYSWLEKSDVAQEKHEAALREWDACWLAERPLYAARIII